MLAVITATLIATLAFSVVARRRVGMRGAIVTLLVVVPILPFPFFFAILHTVLAAATFVAIAASGQDDRDDVTEVRAVENAVRVGVNGDEPYVRAGR